MRWEGIAKRKEECYSGEKKKGKEKMEGKKKWRKHVFQVFGRLPPVK
jgi:hypothetical protein